MTTCPKCGYARKFGDAAPDLQCPSCGIVYAKFHAASLPEVKRPGMVVQSEESLRLYAFGALALAAFVAFVLFGFFQTFREARVIAVLFFGTFLWLAWKGAVKWLRSVSAYVNFGTVQLVLERAPAVGGELRGTVEFESGAAALAKLDAEFVCTLEIPKAPNGSLPAETRMLHRETTALAVQVETGHRRAPFAFAIPDGLPPSGEGEESGDDGRTPSCNWKLRLHAPNAGGNLTRSFELEVLPVGAPAPDALSQGPATESAIALVVANLIPLAMVFLGLGSVGGLVVLYWAENVVIGFYTVLRMLEAGRGAAGEKAGKTLFFCLHYGGFCFVHGVFVAALFLTREQHTAFNAQPQWPGPFFFLQMLIQGAGAMGLLSPRGLLLPLLALIVSHGISFYTNYLRNGRYLTSKPDDSFMRPYPRMILLHVFIIGGGIFAARYGTSMLPLAVLVIGKTLIDLGLHRRSNRADPL